MTEDKKAQPDWWPPGRRPASKWWLLATNESLGVRVLVADCGGEQALPVFSGEGEAEMFVWLGDAFEDGWRVRETSAGELVSILYGPCAGVGKGGARSLAGDGGGDDPPGQCKPGEVRKLDHR